MENSPVFYVYILFRAWNGIPFYVGKGYGKRAFKLKWRSNQHFNNVVARSGGVVPTVILHEGLDEVTAFSYEVALIAAIGRGKKGPLVNLTDGGEGASGAKRTDETKSKMSVAAKGNKRSLGQKRSTETCLLLKEIGKNRDPKHLEAMHLANRGRPLSEAHKEKLAERKRGVKQSPEHIAARAESNRGGKRSKETKAKMSKSQQGNQHFLGKNHSEEAKEKMRVAAILREEKRRQLRLAQLQEHSKTVAGSK